MNFLSNPTPVSPFALIQDFFKRSIRFAAGIVAVRSVRRGLAASVAVVVLLSAGGIGAQTTTLLPSVITTIAGNTPTVSTPSAACPTNAQFTATDANGNGCPAVNAVIPSTATGIAVDPEGNVYVSANSTNPQIVRKIDVRTGLITAFAGASASQCASGTGTTIYGTKAAQQDKNGDNCPVSSSYGFNGPVSLGTDPYGNLLIGTTGDNVVHFVCNAASPICSAQAASENLMQRVVGCSLTGGTTSYASAYSGNTAVGTGGDGTAATQFSGTTCTTGVGGKVYAPTADKWDNVYFMDGSNGRLRVVAGPASIVVNGVTLANPLYAALEISTGTSMDYSSPQQGYIYPIAGGGTVCSGETDAEGDGCPFYQTLVNTSSSGSLVQGTAVDHEGDFIFDDGEGNLRVIYMGGTVIKGALAANGVASPQIGYSYRLAGGGTSIYYNSGDPGIEVGSSASLQSGAIQTLAVDPAGNIVIGDQLQVLFYDIATGYIRRLGTANAATLCNSSAVGDGCPLGQSKFGLANKALPIAEDSLGNLYMLDINDLLVRRVSTLTLPSTVVNNAANTATTNSTITVHSPVAGSAVTLVAGTGSDFTVGAQNCTTNSDSSVDCSAAVTFAPQTLAQRTDPLLVTTTGTSATTESLAFNAESTGSALTFDASTNPATSVLGSSTTGNSTVLLDGSGNVYVSGTQGISRISGSTVSLVSTTAAAYMAVDAAGDVYATNGSATSVTEYLYSPATGNYTSSTVTLPSMNLCTTTTSSISCATMQAYSGPMVVDAYGFLYFADLVNKQVIKYSPTTGIAQQLTQTALVSPTAMGEDGYGNLLVIDGTSVLKIPSSGFAVTPSSPVSNPTLTFATPLVKPTSVTADQGGNVYVADSGKIDVLPVSGYEYTVPGIAGSSVAVDGAGNLYTVSTSVAGVAEDARSAASFDFGTSITESYNGVFANAGATSPTGFSQTDTSGNFTLSTPTSGNTVATSAPTCNLSSTVLISGSVCNASIAFTPTANGSGVVQNVVTLLPATDTLGSVAVSGTKSGTNASTTTVVTGTTSGLIYSTGTEATFTVTVAETPAAVPSGSVAVTIDGGTAVNYTLVGATSSTATTTVTVSGLTAGVHTIVAAYASSAGIVGSTSSPATDFTIGQASTTVVWTPAAAIQQYSAAVGAGVLDAIATPNSGVGSVAGSFLYTATPSGGTAIAIHPASYLPIGTYMLAVTFVPTDSVDYATSTSAVVSYIVTKANTTAAVGATQMLVASDGTGNYSSVQAAVNQLPTGGAVYIKPGTYKGFVTIVQPNISLIGLGGDPTKVILTSESGAFGSSYPYIGEFTATNSNGSQLPSGSTVFTGDEGSATMVISKGVNTALSSVQQMPSNFYGEDFTILNTYDSDSTTTTTTYASTSNGTCAAGQSTAVTYASLFNTGQLCASQALAIWTTADLSVMNNIYATSLQDTVYAASPGSGSNGYVPTRQYWFRGKVTGDVDYIFGDAAAVFDTTSIYTMWHGATATGTETIHAQNKAIETGASGDYLSGYVMNNDVFTSQSTGMTNLYLGRPYGTYSTWIMLNSYVDQVNATGYTTGLGPALVSATFDEYNDATYVDPATGSPDLNGIPYLGTGGNTGEGVTGVRETSSTNPGTPMASNNPPTSMTQAQAQAYFPDNFLGQTVSSALSTTQNWVPTASIAAYANGFVPAGSAMTAAAGSSVTILIRPQTPGLGAITNGTYTVPTGTYTLSDTYGGNTTVLATGTLDAAGEASYTSSALGAGVHDLSWTYGGDGNFNGSTTESPYVLTVAGASTTTTLSAVSPITFGQSASITATVSTGSGVPSGTVVLTIDGGTTQSLSLTNGAAMFTVAGLSAGAHTFSASYGGSTEYSSSATTSNLSVTVAPYTPVLTWTTPTSITYGQPLSATQLDASVMGTSEALDGKYTYNPAAGVYLPAGTSEALSVSFTPTDATDYSNVSGATTITVNKASTTLTAPTTQPVLVSAGQAGTIPVTIAGQYSGTGIAAPSGGVTYAVVNASSATVASGTATIASGAVSVPVASTLASGLYTVNVSYAGDTNYAASTAPVAIHVQVGQLQPTITWATPAAISYGTSLAGVLNAGAYNGATVVPGTYSYLNGSTAITPSTILPAGSYTLTVNFVPTDATTYDSATGTLMLTVNKIAIGSVSIVSNINPLLIENATTFTATVTSTVSTPSGSVNFYDTTNSTSLGSVNLSGGIATLSVSSLAVGTHSVTAIYSGDTNFLTATSTAVSEVVQDFTLNLQGGSGGIASQTVSPGGTATYNFTLTPSGATFPAAVSLTVTGLPTGATYTITPATITAGSGATNVTLLVSVPKESAAVYKPGGFTPIAFGLLLLPFSVSIRKRTGRIRRLTAVLLLLVGGTVFTGMMTGCGSSPSQSPQSYTLTITGTSGTLTHSTTVTLTVK